MASKRSVLTPTLIAIVGFLTVCPVVMLIFGSFSTGLGAFGQFTLNKYIQAYTDPELTDIIVNTIVFVLGSSLVATGLALLLAYLNTRTDIPFKFLFRIISIIPMMIPHILFSVSWVLLLNPSNGLINLFLRQIPGFEDAAINIYSLSGMILVEGLLDLPIAYLILAPALASFDIALEESSKVCGSTTLRTLFRVTLPVLRPAILAAFILSLVRSLASFAVPSVIGMPGRIHVLATHIYQSVATGFAADFGRAAAIGMSVLAASITLIYILPLSDLRRRKIRDHFQPRIPAHRYRTQGGQVSPVRHRRHPVHGPDRPAGTGAVLHFAGALFHDSQRQGFFHDELEALDRGNQ